MTPSAFQYAGVTGRPWPVYPGQMVSHLAQVVDPRTGRPGPIVKNPAIDGIKYYYLGFEDATQTASRIAIPANQTAQANWRVDAAQNLRGDFEAFEFVGEFEDSRFLCKGHIGSPTDRNISNVHIPVNCLFGTGQWPHELAESLWLESLTSMDWDLVNLTANEIIVSLSIQGRRFVNYDIPGLNREAIVQAFQQRRQHVYYMSWDRIGFDSGGVLLTPLQDRDDELLTMTVPGDGDFICFGVMDDSDGDYDILMEGGRSGQRLMNTMIPRSMFAGVTSGGGVTLRRAASNPKRWRQPHLFNRGTRIHFRIRNRLNANNVVRIVLYGVKSYAPELGKAPIELIGQGLVPLPIMTHGSGNWGALQPGAGGELVTGPAPVPLVQPAWRTPG